MKKTLVDGETLSAIPVLICDDSRLARKQMAKSLVGWNVDLSFAEHGLEALELIRAGRADLMFLDLTMPILDGYQTLERIRRDDLPVMVIVVSADIQPEARKRVLELGALDFIKKPINSELVSVVLRKYGLLDELSESDSVGYTKVWDVIQLSEYYQEISNIAVGLTGNMLSTLLRVFVHLPVPKVSPLTQIELNKQLLASEAEGKLMVTQGFACSMIAGEAITIFDSVVGDNLYQLFCEDKESATDEVLLSLSNILAGAFISSFEQQLDLGFSRTTPVILKDFVGLPERSHSWESCMSISVGYSIPEYQIQCQLLVVFTEDSAAALRQLASYF